MRILIISFDSFPHVGGKSTHIGNLRKGLTELGHHVEIISSSDIPLWIRLPIIGGTTFVLRKALGARGKNITTLWNYKLRELFLARIVGSYLRRWKYDIINTHDVVAENIVRGLSNEIPAVLTIHGDWTNERLSAVLVTKDSRAERRLLSEERQAYLSTDRIIAVDNRLKDHVVLMVRASEPNLKIKVIHNFVDTNEFRIVSAAEKRALRRKWGYDEDTWLILCPRRLTPKNGVIYAAQAMVHLRGIIGTHQKVKSLFAGDGSEREAIREVMKRNSLEENIILLGNVVHNQMPELYHISDVVLIPSVASEGVIEATSISALEAMACGVPVIASNIGGLTELISNGLTGILVPQANPLAIAEAITRLMNDSHLRSDIGRRARQHAVNNHSHLRAAEEFIVFSGSEE